MEDETRRLVIELAVTAAAVWLSLPAHQQREMLMWVAYRSGKTASWLAAKTARWAMLCELAGDRDAADVGYRAAYEVMTGPYRQAADWYERLRMVS